MKSNTTVFGILMLVVLGLVGLEFFVYSDSSDISRTQKYLKLVGKIQADQNTLKVFIQAQEKVCNTSGQMLQLTNDGILACVSKPPEPPKVEAPAPQPTPVPHPKH